MILANFFIRYLEERMKVPWPVSEREALLHYFELEYLKEDVVIVIMKTVRLFLFYSILDSFWELLPTALMYPFIYLVLIDFFCRYQIWIL